MRLRRQAVPIKWCRELKIKNEGLKIGRVFRDFMSLILIL
jgi:hypothetical protein